MKNIIINALIYYKVSISEYQILSIFDRESTQNRSGLARYASEYYSHIDPTSVQDEEEYEKAIDSCLDKQLIKVLSEDDCQKDIDRWENDDNQFCSEIAYSPGQLDFTIKGEGLYRQIAHKIGRHYFDVLAGYKWHQKGIVSILTKNRKNIEETIEEISANPLHLFTCNEKLVEIGKPYTIGPWWITRFHQLESGWRVDIKYKENDD